MDDLYMVPCLLVSMPQLLDPNFKDSVSLLVEHNKDGAYALTLNRPSDLPLAMFLKSPSIKINDHVPAWVGGPVGTDQGMILAHEEREVCEDEEMIAEHTRLTSSQEALSEMMKDADQYQHDKSHKTPRMKHPYRFLVGYAGWGAGQLDEEVRRGAWMHIPFDIELVFNTPWSEMYEVALTRVGITRTNLVSNHQAYLS